MRTIVLAIALALAAFALSVVGDLAGAPRRNIAERARIPSHAAEAQSSDVQANRDASIE